MFYGIELLKVKLNDGYWLMIFKLSKLSGETMTSEQIQLVADPFIHKTKGEMDDLKRRDILNKQLNDAFPYHYVNIFIFENSDWHRNSYNIKGSAYYEKNYGSEVDIILT